MSTEEPAFRRLRAGDADRDRAVHALRRARAAGRLTDDELGERAAQAMRAVHLDELPELLADLPEQEGWDLLPAAPPATPALPVAADPVGAVPASVPVPRYEALPATAPEDRGFSATVMSGRDIALEPGTIRLSNFAWWGGNNYDLSRAMGPGRTVTLTLSAVMAGSEILVPRGVRVVDQTIAIMAGNEVEVEALGDGANGTLVLKGFLWWAGNTVKLAPDRHRL